MEKDLPAEGTFLAMQKEIRGLTAVVDQVLAENVARESGQHIIGTRWLPTRKRKLRKVCAPESSPKTLQVVSLLEVWALWNLTPCGSKRHAIHQWLYSLYTEDTWKATTRVHRVMCMRKIGREHSTYCGRNLVCDQPVSQYSIGLWTYHFLTS